MRPEPTDFVRSFGLVDAFPVRPRIHGVPPLGLRRGIPSSASFATILFPCAAGLTCLSTCRILPSRPM
jgi:hypothetical protein